MAVDSGKTPAIPPTITITDAETEKSEKPTGPSSTTDPTGKIMPGEIPSSIAAEIPQWFKAGWREVGGIDVTATTEEEQDKGLLDAFLSEQWYGAWYHNAAIIFFVSFASLARVQYSL